VLPEGLPVAVSPEDANAIIEANRLLSGALLAPVLVR
jgi:hypothetical protein